MENFVNPAGIVKIVADLKTGLVVNLFPGNTTGEAYFTVEQRGETYFDDKGYLREPLRVTRMRGKFEKLLAMAYNDGDEFGGTIIRKNSFTPFYVGQKPTMNPQTKVNVLKDGKETYFQFVRVKEENAKDYWVDETPVSTTQTVPTSLAQKLVEQI